MLVLMLRKFSNEIFAVYSITSLVNFQGFFLKLMPIQCNYCLLKIIYVESTNNQLTIFHSMKAI